MFTILRYRMGYKISTGDGAPVHACNLEEVQRAVAHYFGLAHGSEDAAGCPFCWWIATHRPRRKGKA